MLRALLASVLVSVPSAMHAPVPASAASPPVAAAPQSPDAPALGKRARVPANLLRPLPSKGGIPRMVPEHRRPGTPEQWARYDATFAAVKSRSFAGTASGKSRDAGLETVRASVDPASFESMYGALRGQKHDVLLAMLDAFAKGGPEGQFALASVAIQDPDAAIRAEATRRLQQPPSDAVLAAIDDGLRSTNHDWIDRAGILAGATHAVEAIPALIFAQSANTSDGTERGDRAWIAIGRTISYVQNVVPVVGDNAAGFQPVIGQLIEGVVMQVQDCVVTIYHGGVHDSLVAMTTYDSGADTSRLAWDMRAWARWFNETYVPLKLREDKELAAASASPAP